MVKKIYLITIVLFTFAAVKAQVGIGTNTPNASAALDVTSCKPWNVNTKNDASSKISHCFACNWFVNLSN